MSLREQYLAPKVIPDEMIGLLFDARFDDHRHAIIDDLKERYPNVKASGALVKEVIEVYYPAEEKPEKYLGQIRERADLYRQGKITCERTVLGIHPKLCQDECKFYSRVIIDAMSVAGIGQDEGFMEAINEIKDKLLAE